MFKKSLLCLFILIVGAMLVSAGCGSVGNDSNPPGGSGTPSPGELTGQGSGWPSSSKLSGYTLGSWNQPSGISGISWEEKRIGQSDTYYMLYITFNTATTDTKSSIDNYLGTWATDGNLIQSKPNFFEGNYTKAVNSFSYSVMISYNLSTGGYINLTRVSESDINPLAMVAQ